MQMFAIVFFVWLGLGTTVIGSVLIVLDSWILNIL